MFIETLISLSQYVSYSGWKNKIFKHVISLEINMQSHDTLNLSLWEDFKLCKLPQILVSQTVKNLPDMKKTWVQSLGWEDSLEEGMAKHSNTLA